MSAPSVRLQKIRTALLSDTAVLIWMAIALVTLHCLTNNQYGFHRDELNFLDDGRHLAWGYVDCPPFTPFIAHVTLSLFGGSLVGLRLFPALAQGLVLILAGLMARELGAARWGQVVAALAVSISPVAISSGNLFMYVTFDLLWWVAAGYGMICLLKRDDPRWWLWIGAAIGLGMLNRYTIAWLVAGIVAGVLFTPARRYLRSPWLWAGAGLALLLFLPNLVWMAQHDFITLSKLASVHARDVSVGWTSSFLTDQLYVSAHIVTIVFWVNGLRFYLLMPEGRRYRPLGWMFVVPFVLFLVSQGRGYYTAPAYPTLIAAGVTLASQRRQSFSRDGRINQDWWVFSSLAIGGLVAWALAAPVAPLGSAWWRLADSTSGNYREEVGWPGLVQTVASVRDGLPAQDQASLGILAGNYGEAGAIDLYGPAYGLPTAISGIDSYWLWGYGDPPPETLIVIGLKRGDADSIFETCAWAAANANPYGIQNEETRDHPDIFVCRGLRQSWPEFWKGFHYFG
ncbi:MAG TPA: glycosyltransferase family 39 protein [Anaerolineales bacterium]|nr:glycosyltransferase family 39 protein [Anaerolineales bacterium]